MSSDGRFEGLPKPVPGELTIYAFGPGFGESMVVVLPDSLTLVIDSCVSAGKCLPAGLLEWLEIERIDLLAVTHPDADHVLGLDTLIESFRVQRIWRYPTGTAVRDFLAMELRKNEESKRLSDLRDVHQAILDAKENGVQVISCACGTPEWRGAETAGPAYVITSLGPTTKDEARMRAQFHKLFEFDGTRWSLSDRVLKALTDGRSWSDSPNIVSTALCIRWGPLGVMLGGDIENGLAGDEHTGWKGVLKALEGGEGEPDRRSLLDNLTLVNVAHHGSAGAYWKDVWTRHEPVDVVLLAPFNRGNVKEGKNPPHVDALKAMGGHAQRLVITSSEGEAQTRAVTAAWAEIAVERVPATAAVAVVTLTPAGVERIVLGEPAKAYSRS